MIHTDNAPIKHVTAQEFAAKIAYLDRKAALSGCDIPPAVAEWMREQEAALDPANALKYPAA